MNAGERWITIGRLVTVMQELVQSAAAMDAGAGRLRAGHATTVRVIEIERELERMAAMVDGMISTLTVAGLDQGLKARKKERR